MLSELLKKIKSNKNIVYYVIIAVIVYFIYTEYKKKETFISHSVFQNSLRNSSTIEILPSDTSEERMNKIKMLPSTSGKIQLQNGLKDLVLKDNLAIIIPGGEFRMSIVITEPGIYNFSFDVFAPGVQNDSFFMQLQGDDVNYNTHQQKWYIPRRDASLQKQIRRESWKNLALQPGKYSLFIRGREPTGISSMTITKVNPAPAPAPAPAPTTRVPKTTRIQTIRVPKTTRVPTTTRIPMLPVPTFAPMITPYTEKLVPIAPGVTPMITPYQQLVPIAPEVAPMITPYQQLVPIAPEVVPIAPEVVPTAPYQQVVPMNMNFANAGA